MTDPTGDERWAADLARYAEGAAPEVPVDVPGALRRGRRRTVRSVALGGGALAVASGVVLVATVAVPSLLGGLGAATDSAADSGAPAAVADRVGGTAAASSVALTVEDLVAGFADGSLMRFTDQTDGTATAEPLTVVQDGPPDVASTLSAIETVTGASAAPSPAPSGIWPTATVACLVAGGWDVRASDDGWQAEVEPVDAQAFLVAVGGCTSVPSG